LRSPFAPVEKRGLRKRKKGDLVIFKIYTFAFQITMTMVSGDGGGLILRANETAGDFYFFHVFPDGSYHLYINTNNELGAELATGTIPSSAFSSGFGKKNTLTAIAQGAHLAFYANGHVLTAIENATYTTGYLSVLSSASTAPGAIIYTNARIWLL
jgi:hypothetical protein